MGAKELTALQSIYYPLRWKYDGRNYAFDDALAHLAKYESCRIPGFGNPHIPEDKKQRVLDLIRNWINRPSDEPWIQDLKDFESKALNKWYGPQGATPTSREVMSVLAAYYDKVIPELELPSLTDMDYAILASLLKRDSYTFLTPRALYVKYRGDRKSNSGVTGWTDRRSSSTRKRAIMEATLNPIRIDPAVAGTRDQRCKIPCRTIFMDSFANYYREVQAFRIFEAELKDCENVMWRGDRYVERYVNMFLKSAKSYVFFEGDYEMLDSWVQKEHVQWLLSIFNDLCIIDPALYEYQLNITVELFRMPLWTPEGEIEQFHALFSGIYPTNPAETPLNLIIQIKWINSVVAPHVGRNLILNKDYIIIVQGDDSLVVFRDISFSDDDLVWLQESFSSFVWTNFHIKANASKQRVSRSSGFFCKRQYKTSGFQYSPFESNETFPKSLYPLTLACLSIFEPEDGALDSKAQSLVKLFQVMDNSYGHPIWKMILRELWVIQPELHIPVSQEDVEQFNAIHNKNWRLVIFGERFSIEKSPSARLWLKWSK